MPTSEKVSGAPVETPSSRSVAKARSAGPMLTMSGVGVQYPLLAGQSSSPFSRLLQVFAGARDGSGFWALQGIDLQLSSGDVLGVVGRNGCGKSTLLRVMSRVIEPTAGTVSVSGTVYPILELGAAFNGELTGRENVYLNASLMKMSREQVDEMIPQIVSFSELGVFFDMPVKAYSSGMRARLAFALNTQSRPEILILDEVMSVGDEQFQKKSLLWMRRMIEQGTVVVMVAHSAPFIEQVCNRAIYLDAGRIAAEGPVKTVLSKYRSAANF